MVNLRKYLPLLFLVFIFLLPNLLVAQNQLGDFGITVSPNEALSIRSGPGTDYTILGTLFPSNSVLALGRNNYLPESQCTERWVNVLIVEGFDGWVNACSLETDNFPFQDRPLENLRIVEPKFPELISESVPLETITGAESPIENSIYATWTQGNLVMREGPGLGNSTIGVVPASETVEMIQQIASGAWVQIRYRGSVGWVLRGNLHIGPLQEGLPFYVPPSPPPPQDEGDYAVSIDENGVVTYVDGSTSAGGGNCRYEYRQVLALQLSSGSAYNYGYAGSTYSYETQSVYVCD